MCFIQNVYGTKQEVCLSLLIRRTLPLIENQRNKGPVSDAKFQVHLLDVLGQPVQGLPVGRKTQLKAIMRGTGTCRMSTHIHVSNILLEFYYQKLVFGETNFILESWIIPI